MQDNNDFETITLSNVWIKEHILDVIKAINYNEIIAESGGIDLITLNEMENVEIIKLRIDALKLMKAYVLQLKDNVSQYIKKEKLIMIHLKLNGIESHQPLMQNNKDVVNHSDSYFLSSDFQVKLNKLRIIKSILINACGEAELLMPKRSEQVKGKKVTLEED